jgi:hypothetical protein
MALTKRDRDRDRLQARSLKPLIVTTDGRQRILPAPTTCGYDHPRVLRAPTPRFQAAIDRNMAALRWVVDRNQR